MSDNDPFSPAPVDASGQRLLLVDSKNMREDHARHGTLILSLGNPMRHDDGVGAAVIQRLANDASLPQGVELLDADMPGLEIILLVQRFQRLMLIDAADLGLHAGEWMRIPLHESQVQLRCAEHPISSHVFGLAEALSFGRVMKLLPPEILFYGVQPEELSWSYGLSESVSQAVEAIAVNILETLQQTPGWEPSAYGTVPYPCKLEASSITLSTAQTHKG